MVGLTEVPCSNNISDQLRTAQTFYSSMETPISKMTWQKFATKRSLITLRFLDEEVMLLQLGKDEVDKA
jgi:hypothetical protein